tara:strand:- start:7955 stop:8395 length:441 start_codon:yes stop_codon:yes gene_type:complete
MAKPKKGKKKPYVPTAHTLYHPDDWGPGLLVSSLLEEGKEALSRGTEGYGGKGWEKARKSPGKEVRHPESRRGESVKPAKLAAPTIKPADTSKGEARSERPCKGSKELYKGDCEYPGYIKIAKKAAKKRRVIREGKKVLRDIGRKK